MYKKGRRIFCPKHDIAHGSPESGISLAPVHAFCRLLAELLRRFEKIWPEPGQEKTLTLSIGFEDFAFIHGRMEQGMEPGEFVICVGTMQTRIFLGKG